jgi:5-methylthioadenosine/S-adenosylhomocysteine deaminase
MASGVRLIDESDKIEARGVLLRSCQASTRLAMFCTCGIHRRGLFTIAAGAFAAASLRPFAAFAQTAPSSGGTALPQRGNFLVRGGQVLTMDDTLGDLAKGDVHVRDGAIVAVGENLSAPDAEIIDANAMIVMPGFVDTHWHLWSTALRMNVRADDPKDGYFPTTIRVGRFYTPADSYTNVRFGVAEGLLSGITTVHNWCHNTVSPLHADAELQAMKDIGIRGRYSYGAPQGLASDKPSDLPDIARVQKQWVSGDGMLGVGACLRTPAFDNTRGAISVDLFRTELEAVHKLGLQATIHCGPKNLIDLLGKNKFLGPGLLLVHPQGMTDDELKMIGETSSPWSTAPMIEMSYSFVRSGRTQYAELKALGVPLGLSIDASTATNTDYFNVMRSLMWSDWQRTGAPVRVKPRELVSLATIGGAKVMGLADKVGSLTPGKRADLILVRANDMNLAPVKDPYHAMVFHGQPSNVDTVMVDGRILVRRSAHTAIDVPKLLAEAADSAQGIEERSRRG